MLFNKTKEKNNKKLTALYEDIKKHTIKVQRLKSKNQHGESAGKEYCSMIKIEELYLIIEKHIGIIE